MGKAACEYTPELPLDDPRWFPIEAAHKRLTGRTGDRGLAGIDLTRELAQGRLSCIARSTATGERRRIEPAMWIDKIQLDAWPESARVIHYEPRSKGERIVKPFRGALFYVWRPDFVRIWPTAGATVERDDKNAPPRVRPGPKHRDDWPTKLAQWLIKVAVEDPTRLHNVKWLVTEAQSQLSWAPNDPKVLRAKIIELLLDLP